jgi:FixJ family two-component response regulator
MTPEDTLTAFVIDDDAAVRASIQGRVSVSLWSEAFGTAEEFLYCKRPDGPGCLVLEREHSWSQRSGLSARVG